MMHAAVSFVLAQEPDAKRVVACRKCAWAATYRGIYPDEMLDNFDDAWHMQKERSRIQNQDYLVYLIRKDSCDIGYLTIRTAEPISLRSLYLLPEYQRQGIGTLAFRKIREHCAVHRTDSFVCQCHPDNQNARRFYQKMGGTVIAQDLNNEESWQNSVTYQFPVEAEPAN